MSELYEAWEDCKKDSKSIEVLYKNDENKKVLAKVHFRTYDTVKWQLRSKYLIGYIITYCYRINCQKH